MARPDFGKLAIAAGAAGLVAPVVAQVRVARAQRTLTDRWRRLPVAPRGDTELGISFRPRQAETLGLDPDTSLKTLLSYPFGMIRLGAYWDRMEPEPGRFVPEELDRQVDAAEAAGKKIILCVGAVKTFGYPEYFVPEHLLDAPLPEGDLITPSRYHALTEAATEFVARVVARYRDRSAIVAWQVEHDAVDPLGMEHSWRLAASFVRAEIEAVRTVDPDRPVMLNGFLPTSLPVGLQQWWRTRDQGDSLAVAQELADIVGIDFYPRHAVFALGSHSVYLDGGRSPWQQARRRQVFARAARTGQGLIVSESQAEPWEAVTNPPNPHRQGMYSLLPERLIENYNQCMSWQTESASQLSAFLFWGAEYWLLREQHGDPRYLSAFARVLENA
jgi:hypothetical protein